MYISKEAFRPYSLSPLNVICNPGIGDQFTAKEKGWPGSILMAKANHFRCWHDKGVYVPDS